MPAASRAKKIANRIAFVVLAGAVAARVFFVGYFRIPQDGMYPGLPTGSGLLTNKRAYHDAASVQRGDIVVFVREEANQRYNYIWRVVGLPGEKIETFGENLAINNQPVQRHHVRDTDGKAIYQEQIGTVSYEVAFETSPRSRPPDATLTVPAGQFFVMGDNRFNARDSRYFGPVSFDSIIGKKL